VIKRQHQLLAGVLIVQLVLSAVVFWPRPFTAVEGEPLFVDLEAGDITLLALEDAAGNLTRLAQVEGGWVLPEADNYPAKTNDVVSFLDRLLALRTDRLVTRGDASHRRLGVSPDEFVRRISFQTGGGEEQTVYLGTAPRFGSVHFRLGGQSETYLTSELATHDAAATISTWVDLTYQRLEQEDVQRFTLENGGGTFVFERVDEDLWVLLDLDEDETLDLAAVRGVLRRAASVTMRSPLGRDVRPEYGMDAPAARVTMELDDTTVTILVGAKDAEDASYVVKSSESEYYVSVAETSVRQLVETGREDLLEQRPDPEEEPDGS